MKKIINDLENKDTSKRIEMTGPLLILNPLRDDDILLAACSVSELPESVNRIWRSARGHTYKTAAAKAWQASMVAALTAARRYPPYEGPVKLVIRLTRHDRRRWDLDNRIKSIQDCLAPAGVILDDVQVSIIYAQKLVGEADRTEVEVWKL